MFDVYKQHSTQVNLQHNYLQWVSILSTTQNCLIFFPQCIFLRDSIVYFTFLCLKRLTFATTCAFSQSTSLTHSTLCLANPPSSFPFFLSPLPTFCSLDLRSSISLCSYVAFFLSSTAFTFLPHIPHLHGMIILYTAPFCFSPSGC